MPTRRRGGRSSTDEATREAFGRLLAIARPDTGQARSVASFILAWWNADSLGGFDIADLFAVDRAIARDMSTVFAYIANRKQPEYPTHYQSEIEELIRLWRPEIWAKASEPT